MAHEDERRQVALPVVREPNRLAIGVEDLDIRRGGRDVFGIGTAHVRYPPDSVLVPILRRGDRTREMKTPQRSCRSYQENHATDYLAAARRAGAGRVRLRCRDDDGGDAGAGFAVDAWANACDE